MAAARKKTALQRAARAVLKAVEGLHPDEALVRLEPVAAAEGPGLRRRVLLSARIELLRRALEMPRRQAAEPEPLVVVLPEPEPVAVVAEEPKPPRPPKALSKGTMMSVSLEDAAKLLFVAPEPEPEGDVAEAAGAAPAEAFVPASWTDAAQQVDGPPPDAAPDTVPDGDAAGRGGETVILDDLDAAVASLSGLADDSAMFPEDPPAVAAPPRKAAKGGKVKGRKGSGPVIEDMETLAAFATGPSQGGLPAGIDADLAKLAALDALSEAVVAADPPAGMVDPAAAFAALAAADEDEARAMLAPVRGAVVDHVAAMAALEELGPVMRVPPAPADPEVAGGEAVAPPAPRPRGRAALDPSAAFAAMEEAEVVDPATATRARPAPVMDAAAAFAALEAADEAEAKSIAPAGKPKPLAIDLSAQFAALGKDAEE